MTRQLVGDMTKLSDAGEVLAQGSREQRLVAEAQAGDGAAFTALFDQYHGPITGYLARLTGNRDAADDLTQETFLKAYRGLGRTGADLSFRPWLYRIATNTARSWQRRQRIVRWLPFGDDAGTPEPRDERDLATALGEHEAVVAALRSISPAQASILLLRHDQGLTVEEAAVVMKVSTNTAKVRLHRARKAFASAYAALDSGAALLPPGEQR